MINNKNYVILIRWKKIIKNVYHELLIKILYSIYNLLHVIYIFILKKWVLFVFNLNGNTWFELILKYFRVLINRLKKLKYNHNIYLIIFQ